MIHHIQGNAAQPDDSHCIIAHVCNNRGGWGAGFTGSLDKAFRHVPGPKGAYKDLVYQEKNAGGDWEKRLLGISQFWPQDRLHDSEDIRVVNMIAQNGYASHTQPCVLDYNALNVCLHTLYTIADILCVAYKFEIPVHMPRIGAGLAGGDWDVILPMIAKAATVETYIYTPPSS
jgi:O-acetyl-ADP-ribose deacetylase (regulator of RNase III)